MDSYWERVCAVLNIEVFTSTTKIVHFSSQWSDVLGQKSSTFIVLSNKVTFSQEKGEILRPECLAQ